MKPTLAPTTSTNPRPTKTSGRIGTGSLRLGSVEVKDWFWLVSDEFGPPPSPGKKPPFSRTLAPTLKPVPVARSTYIPGQFGGGVTPTVTTPFELVVPEGAAKVTWQF